MMARRPVTIHHTDARAIGKCEWKLCDKDCAHLRITSIAADITPIVDDILTLHDTNLE